MTRQEKTVLIALPLTVLITAAATVAVLVKPWGVLQVLDMIGTSVAGPSSTGTPPPAAAISEHVVDTATEAIEPTIVEIPPAFDDAETVTLPVGPELQTQPADEVDYARLNHDVRIVADTLERFNQKLLRMIAQAKASQRPDGPVLAAETPIAPSEEAIAQ